MCQQSDKERSPETIQHIGENDITETIVEKMKGFFGDDRRRINHALDVLDRARAICKSELRDDPGLVRVALLAAVLHDVGIKPAEALYGSSAPVYQHREGPPIAERILTGAGVEKEVVDRVCYIIGNHHHKSKIDGRDFQVLWEADLIVNMPDLAIIRNGNYDRYKKMVLNNFRTMAGVQMALGLWNPTP
ncbi:MAG: HD domain-containing protein [Bacillota bacterium]